MSTREEEGEAVGALAGSCRHRMASVVEMRQDHHYYSHLASVLGERLSKVKWKQIGGPYVEEETERKRSKKKKAGSETPEDEEIGDAAVDESIEKGPDPSQCQSQMV